MIQKVVNKRDLHDFSSVKEDLVYWLSKTSEERVAAVDYFRKQYHRSTERLRRSALLFLNIASEESPLRKKSKFPK